MMYFAEGDSDFSVLLSAFFNKATLVLNILQQEPLRMLQRRLNFRKTHEIYRVDVITRQWVLPFLRARQFICSPHTLFSSTVRVAFLKYRTKLQKMLKNLMVYLNCQKLLSGIYENLWTFPYWRWPTKYLRPVVLIVIRTEFFWLSVVFCNRYCRNIYSSKK